MLSDYDYTIWRLQREKSVWRGIAIALAATLILLIGVGALAGFVLAKRSQLQAVRAKGAMMEAIQQRDLAERARMEARRAAQVQKAKVP